MTITNEAGRKTRKLRASEPCDFGTDAVKGIIEQLRILLDESLALHARTISLQYYISRTQAQDFLALLEGQAEQISAMAKMIAARIRALGGANRVLARMARANVIADGQAASVVPLSTLSALREDNGALTLRMTELYDLCDDTNDAITAGLIQNWIDETQRRVWFLGEPTHNSEPAILQ